MASPISIVPPFRSVPDGPPHVDLKVREDNVGAIALYQSLRMQTNARE